MEKIRFITDSASDMNSSREDVTILPLHIRFGEEEYADGVTISHKEFYEKLIECDTLPTTSLVSPAVFEEAYEKAVSAGETVIVVTISSKLSGTCQSARIAAEDYEGKVFVVDRSECHHWGTDSGRIRPAAEKAGNDRGRDRKRSARAKA